VFPGHPPRQDADYFGIDDALVAIKHVPSTWCGKGTGMGAKYPRPLGRFGRRLDGRQVSGLSLLGHTDLLMGNRIMRIANGKIISLLVGLTLLTGCSAVASFTDEQSVAKGSSATGEETSGVRIAKNMTKKSKVQPVSSGTLAAKKTKIQRAALGMLQDEGMEQSLERHEEEWREEAASIDVDMEKNLERQETALRLKLAKTGVGVVRNGSQIVLTMPGHITFTSGSSDIKPEFFSVLNSISSVLKGYEQTRVDILGHTDDQGDQEYNQRLSEMRAISVSQYLSTQGVRSERLLTNGFGESRPIASNNSSLGRRLNRRIEIKILPSQV
jgi:outer membrane protein OmpA-like peptidoglycan-associated protein